MRHLPQAALANLSLAPGGEAQMVNDGAVPALRLVLSYATQQQQLAVTRRVERASSGDDYDAPPRPTSADGTEAMVREVSAMCVQALYNLTCVHEIYEGLDSVIKLIIQLPGTGGGANASAATAPQRTSADGKKEPTPPADLKKLEVVVHACCNCSNFFKLRMRMLEAGAVQTLAGAIGGDDPALKLHAARCLHNIASARACRGDMVLRGAVPSLLTLSEERDPDTLYAVAATLQKLTLDVASRKRVIAEGCVRAALHVTRRSAEVRTTRQCALVMYNLSTYADCLVEMTTRGALDVLVALSESSKDIRTRKSCTAAFCHLFAAEEVHAHILQARALRSLFALAGAGGAMEDVDDVIVEALAYALHNMSHARAELHAELVDEGIIASVVTFSAYVPTAITAAAAAKVTAKETADAAAAAKVEMQVSSRRVLLSRACPVGDLTLSVGRRSKSMSPCRCRRTRPRRPRRPSRQRPPRRPRPRRRARRRPSRTQPRSRARASCSAARPRSATLRSRRSVARLRLRAASRTARSARSPRSSRRRSTSRARRTRRATARAASATRT